MKILNFGSCNIDSVYSVSHINLPGETIAADSLAVFPGGKGLNQSIALAKAGTAVYFAGCVGIDGEMLTDLMSEAGVDLKYLKKVREKTGHAIIQVDSSGENCIIIYHGANYCVTREHIDSVLSEFEAGDILLAQNEISNLSYLIQSAAGRGMTVVFNPSPYQEDLKGIPLEKIRWLILNETEAAGLFGSCEPSVIQSLLRSDYPELRVVLTLGKHGSIYIDKERMHSQMAFRVENVDSTAAGDTYTGYFISGITSGNSPEDAMRVASAASALAVARKGASSSIPALQEVKNSLKQLQMYPSQETDRRKAVTLQFFEEHYCDGTVQMLSQALGYTPAYASTWLKENFGAGFTKLLQRKRAEVSAQLLENSQLSVTEIIHLVGYSNESQFRAIFNEIYGCAPLKYRQKKKG